MNKDSDFFRGVRSGIPVFIGYFSAAIAFGLLAVTAGLSVWEATLFSLVSSTGAGQFMSINLMMLGVSAAEAVFSVFLLNFRYMLMSASLSFKIDFPGKIDRFLAAYCITDENFSVISAQEEQASISFVYGLQLTAYTGWAGGTWRVLWEVPSFPTPSRRQQESPSTPSLQLFWCRRSAKTAEIYLWPSLQAD